MVATTKQNNASQLGFGNEAMAMLNMTTTDTTCHGR
jgi:hypothetical protein